MLISTVTFKDFVKEKAELICYAHVTGFILVGSSKALYI